VSVRRRLTPDDLDHEPQLAVLFALEAALVAASTALIASHPELRDGLGETEEDSAAALAQAAGLLADDLRALLRLYRRSLERPPRGFTPFHHVAF